MKSTISAVEEKLKQTSNSQNYIGILIGIIPLFIAAISFWSSIKEPKIDIKIINPHDDMIEYTVGEHPKLFITDTKCIDYGLTQEERWHIQLENTGNKIASNLKIEITIDKFSFNSDYVYDFNVSNPIYGAVGINRWCGRSLMD